MHLTYKTGTATREQILQHLRACDGNFIPALSSRVDLNDYSRKLSEKAVSFECWDNDVLAGMLNSYLDNGSESGFISNVSVLHGYAGRGLGSSLLHMCLDYAADHGFRNIRLEVSPQNTPAVKLYSRAGFHWIPNPGGSYLMQLEIPAVRQSRR